MTLYEIDNEIQALTEQAYDEETGEILDEGLFAMLDGLKMDRDNKVESIGCYIKNLNADVEALKKEKMAFAQRQKVAENRVESLKKYLAFCLDGEKFESTKVKISFRKSTSVEIDEDVNLDDIPEQFIKTTKEIRKDEIKKALKSGEEFSGVCLKEKQSTIIQ